MTSRSTVGILPETVISKGQKPKVAGTGQGANTTGQPSLPLVHTHVHFVAADKPDVVAATPAYALGLTMDL